MRIQHALGILIVLFALAALCDVAHAWEPRGWRPARLAQNYTWHGHYRHTAWGTPVALVVPPTASLQTNWGWGVGNTRITPICHQFERNYPGPGQYDAKAFRPTPAWPSDTDQFGVYYVRGPW